MCILITDSAGKLILSLILVCFTFLGSVPVFGEHKEKPGFLTQDEILWLENHPRIRLAPDPDFQPIEFFDHNGNYSGIGADYVRLLEQKLGIKFEIVVCENWDDVITRMKNREVDVLNAVVKTPEREEYLFFPSPYLILPSVILARKSVTEDLTLEKLKGFHIVMVSGYGYVDLIRKSYPEIEIELVPDLKTALRKVSFSMADAFVGDLASASYYIESEGITNLKIAGESYPPNISGFAVRSDWPELAGILEKGVSRFTEKERDKIKRKWIHLESNSGVSRQELHQYIIPTVFGIILLTGVLILWNLTLKRVVHNRTKDLQQEIRERKAAELALKENEQKFRTMADTSPLAIYMSEGIDQKGIYMNTTFTRMLGYTLEDIESINDWWPKAYPDPEYRETVRNEWETKVREAIESKSQIEPMEVVITCKDGTRKTISWGFISIGRINWASGMDLTERIEQDKRRALLESQLHQAQKMEAVGTLAGGIAHDFNNILAAIMGYAELALLELHENPAAAKNIDRVLLASYRARDLIKQILAFSRKDQEQKAPIQIFTIVSEALKFLRASIPASIQMEEALDPYCGTIMADPTHIHQVVMNLCTNASQSMEENGGVLRIELSSVRLSAKDLEQASGLAPGNYACLCVKDDGSGIDNDIIDRIFDPYFTTKDVGKGSGMGLAVVAGIVRNCGAMIRVDSRKDSGAEFKVYFPLLNEDALIPKLSRESPATGNERILVIDDENTLADIMSRHLKNLGYKVTTSTDSLKAFELFRSDPDAFDLILTDQTMPGLTGDKLAIQILELRPEIPIVICSGYSARIDGDKAEALGIRKFLMKPVELAELSSVVSHLLKSD